MTPKNMTPEERHRRFLYGDSTQETGSPQSPIGEARDRGYGRSVRGEATVKKEETKSEQKKSQNITPENERKIDAIAQVILSEVELAIRNETSFNEQEPIKTRHIEDIIMQLGTNISYDDIHAWVQNKIIDLKIKLENISSGELGTPPSVQRLKIIWRYISSKVFSRPASFPGETETEKPTPIDAIAHSIVNQAILSRSGGASIQEGLKILHDHIWNLAQNRGVVISDFPSMTERQTGSIFIDQLMKKIEEEISGSRIIQSFEQEEYKREIKGFLIKMFSPKGN